MKKSEAIKQLEEILLNTELAAWASCEACSFLKELAKRDAVLVLDAIEKLGMMPPEMTRKMTQKEVDKINKNHWYSEGNEFTVEDTVSGYMWEKEDDN